MARRTALLLTILAALLPGILGQCMTSSCCDQYSGATDYWNCIYSLAPYASACNGAAACCAMVYAPAVLPTYYARCLTSGTTGDPVVQGFDGSRTLLIGESGKIYNLISSPDTQLNMRLVDAELPEFSDLAKLHPGQQGTFIGAFGLQYQDQLVEVEVDRQGILTSVKLNGTEQLTADTELHLDADILTNLSRSVEVSIERYRPWYGQSVQVRTADFDFMFYPTLAYVEEATGAHIRGHLNVKVLEVHLGRKDADSVTGILGATLRNAPDAEFAGNTSSAGIVKPVPSEIKLFDRPEGESAYEVPQLHARPGPGYDMMAPHHPTVARRLMAWLAK